MRCAGAAAFGAPDLQHYVDSAHSKKNFTSLSACDARDLHSECWWVLGVCCCRWGLLSVGSRAVSWTGLGFMSFKCV
jgi:hypothetical protein